LKCLSLQNDDDDEEDIYTEWDVCDDKVEEELEEKRLNTEINLKLNPHGWYAIISSDNFFGPYDIGTSSVPASGRIKKTTVPLTSGDLSGISPGDIVKIKISRNVDADTAAGTAELHKVELRTLNTYPSQFIP
jgi:hypothetical protein